MRKFKKKHTGRNIFLIILVFVFFALYFTEIQVRPLFQRHSEHNAQVMTTDAVNEAVASELERLNYTYEDLVTVQYTKQGAVQGISTNVVNVNKLKAAVTIVAQQKIEAVQDRDIYIPIGDLCGFSLFKGTGPKLKLNIGMTGSVLTDFKSSFTSAGVNQTLHTMNVIILTDLYLTSASFNTELKITTTMPVAETVLMGTTPNFYLNK